jgi:hypothetical protein
MPSENARLTWVAIHEPRPGTRRVPVVKMNVRNTEFSLQLDTQADTRQSQANAKNLVKLRRCGFGCHFGLSENFLEKVERYWLRRCLFVLL